MSATRLIRKPDTGILAWLLLVCFGAQAAYAATAVAPDARAIFYYSPVDDAWNSLLHNARKVSVLAPQVLAVDQTGAVRGSVEERVRALAAEQGIQIMPLLYNEDFSSEIAHSVLGNESLRRRVVSEAVRLCQENQCAGLQLDFEGVAAEDAAGYLSLIQELAAALHERHLYFSVALAVGAASRRPLLPLRAWRAPGPRPDLPLESSPFPRRQSYGTDGTFVILPCDSLSTYVELVIC